MSREADDEVRLAVEMAQLCKILHVLPKQGGLLDQDAYHIHLLKAGLAAMDKKAEHDQKKAAAVKKGRGRH